MVDVSLEDLRELSLRSRRAHARGTHVVLAGMMLLPVFISVHAHLPDAGAWVALGGLALVGALFVRFAHAAGQSRGAYRRLFRDIRTRKKEEMTERAERSA